MADGQRAVELLESIERLLKQLVAQGRTASPRVAPGRDLDGKHGDPEVRMRDPRDWTGPSMKGRRFSECPAEYLDLLASRFDWMADQAESKNETYNGKPVAPYRRSDAARARGWAKRIRDGRHVQTTPPSTNGSGWADEPAADEDIPF
jgi:hypothetical protein